MQRQAEGVNPALHSSKTIQEAPGVAPNKPGASEALVSGQRGERQVLAASETDPERQLYNQSLRELFTSPSPDRMPLGEPPC